MPMALLLSFGRAAANNNTIHLEQESCRCLGIREYTILSYSINYVIFFLLMWHHALIYFFCLHWFTTISFAQHSIA